MPINADIMNGKLIGWCGVGPIIIFSTILPIKVFPQKSRENGMLMFQIDGNQYEKTSFDKNGNIKSTYLIRITKLTSEQDEYKLKASFFELKNGTVEDSSFANLVCEPQDAQMIANTFPVVTDNPGRTIRVTRLSGSGSLYPVFGEYDSTLENISFKVEIEGGVLGFLGTRSNVLIYDRQLSYDEHDSTLATLTSRVEMKAYLLGIKIKTLNYRVTEKLKRETGIVEQVYQSSSGEYYSIKLKQ